MTNLVNMRLQAIGLPDAVGKAPDSLDDVGLAPQSLEAVLALTPPGMDLGRHGREPVGQLLEPRPGQTVLAVELVGEHPAVVELHSVAGQR